MLNTRKSHEYKHSIRGLVARSWGDDSESEDEEISTIDMASDVDIDHSTTLWSTLSIQPDLRLGCCDMTFDTS